MRTRYIPSCGNALLLISLTILPAFAQHSIGGMPSSGSELAASRPLAPVVEVTAESGYTVTGRLVSWRTSSNERTTEHMAGTTIDSHLIHFFWSPGTNRWRALDLTTLTGVSIVGDVTAWLTGDGPYVVEHVAGRDPSGQLLVLYRSTRSLWRVVNVTAKTGRYLDGGFTNWQTPNGPYIVEHLAARDATGHLLVFWWSPAHDWQVVDVTAKTGERIRSDITNWQVRRDTHLHEYLAAASATDNGILVFSWNPAQDWQVQRTFRASPDGATPWLTGDVEHLAGVAPDGTLFVLWRRGTTAWQRVNVTAITGERAAGRPVAYQLMDGAERVELLGARSPNGHALVYWWKPSRDWQAIDLTEITGREIASPPEAWVTSAGNGRLSEHLAAVGTDGWLRVFYSFDQPRTLTDKIGEEYQGIKRMRNTTRKVVAILWDPHYPRIAKPDRAAVVNALFGATNSVRDYFRENSAGAFGIQSVGALGWYDADRPLDYYDNPDNRHDKAGAALRAADPDFDFSAHDVDGDGTLEPHELAIVFIHPGDADGLVRSGDREIRDLDGSVLILDGVRIREGLEIGIGHPTPNLGVVAHELSHLLLNLPDMYFGFFTPTAAGQYSLMDNTYEGTHIDPFNKLKLGWAHPRIIFRSGRYTVPDIETRHRVLVLMDPSRSTKEYFLIENRWPGTSYDSRLPDQGLAVWHVMEDPDDFDAAPPPPTVDLSMWGSLGRGAWNLKGVRMIRPILTPPFNDWRALWDPSEGDLISDEPDLSRPALRWGNGGPSGFALRDIGSAGSDMKVTIIAP